MTTRQAVVQCAGDDGLNSADTPAVKWSCQMPHIIWSKSDSRERHLHWPYSKINTVLAISKGILGYGIKFGVIWLILYGKSWLWVSTLYKVWSCYQQTPAGHETFYFLSSAELDVELKLWLSFKPVLLKQAWQRYWSYLLKEGLHYEWYWNDNPFQKRTFYDVKVSSYCYNIIICGWNFILTLETVVKRKKS